MRFNPDEYITVHERIEKFYSKFPQGRITTTILEHNFETGFILIRAEVFRESDDALPAATGHAYEIKSGGHVQQGSYVEVCETSAVGRALALLGFEVKRGIASREEMRRAASKRQAAAPSGASGQQQQEQRRAATADRAQASASNTIANAQAPAPQKRATAAASDAETPPDLDAQILQAAVSLGYDAAKVRRWVNQKFEVEGGLASLTDPDKREVLKLFREQAGRAEQAG